jgi:type II secretory pathway component PulK
MWFRRSRSSRYDRSLETKRLSHSGIILLALLWLLTGLSLIALTLASSVRFEGTTTQSNADAEKAYFFAKGGIEPVLYHLAYPYRDNEKQKQFFPYAAGMNHYWLTNEEMGCHVAILDETGKINLNTADEQVLGRLLLLAGVRGAQAGRS